MADRSAAAAKELNRWTNSAAVLRCIVGTAFGWVVGTVLYVFVPIAMEDTGGRSVGTILPTLLFLSSLITGAALGLAPKVRALRSLRADQATRAAIPPPAQHAAMTNPPDTTGYVSPGYVPPKQTGNGAMGISLIVVGAIVGGVAGVVLWWGLAVMMWASNVDDSRSGMILFGFPICCFVLGLAPGMSILGRDWKSDIEANLV